MYRERVESWVRLEIRLANHDEEYGTVGIF